MSYLSVGVLKTGSVHPNLKERFEDYEIILTRLIQDSLPEVKISSKSYDVQKFQRPKNINDHQLYLITGSRFGVYEDLDWIHFLLKVVDEIVHSKHCNQKILGICFGHQIIAKYFGAEVSLEKSGWALGVRDYQIQNTVSWIDTEVSSFSLLGFHQDQVKNEPKDLKVWATSAHCPYAGFYLGSQIMTIQAHPEFSPEYEKALLKEVSSEGRFSKQAMNVAIESVNQYPVHRKLFKCFFRNFFLNKNKEKIQSVNIPRSTKNIP